MPFPFASNRWARRRRLSNAAAIPRGLIPSPYRLLYRLLCRLPSTRTITSPPADCKTKTRTPQNKSGAGCLPRRASFPSPWGEGRVRGNRPPLPPPGATACLSSRVLAARPVLSRRVPRLRRRQPCPPPPPTDGWHAHAAVRVGMRCLAVAVCRCLAVRRSFCILKSEI
jgi:hypothetical protein